MMHRNHEIKVRFTRDELQSLDKKVKKTDMSREAYIRTICNNQTPVQLPPADYYALVHEVRALGNSMNQIAYKAHAMNLLDEPMFRRYADIVVNIADKLTLVTLPRDDEK